jgi:hypothetical protein
MADVEEKVEYEVEWKGGAARDMDNAADRFRAGANAIGKKVRPRQGPCNRIQRGEGKRKARLAFSLIVYKLL